MVGFPVGESWRAPGRGVWGERRAKMMGDLSGEVQERWAEEGVEPGDW
jgi:hypothetical protein